MKNVSRRIGRAIVVLASVGAVLALAGAAAPDAISPGTRIAGSHTEAILTLVNEGTVGDGLRGRASGSGSGVAAWSSAGYGVYATTDAADRSGVIGVGTAAIGVSGRSDTNDGVVGVTQSAVKSGVWGRSSPGVGVTGSSTTNDGVAGFTEASDRSGVFGHSAQGTGVTAQSERGTALYVRGTSIFERYATFQGGHGDIAENYTAGETLSPGDVVCISPAGGPSLVLARNSNDTSVAGVVASDPSLRLAGGIPHGDSIPLAIAGRVLCKVDASFGPIAPGDLLTTSSNPGHAMRAVPICIEGVSFHRPGTILGKALEACREGIGLIEILITMQ